MWSFIGGSVMKNEFDGVSFGVRIAGDKSSKIYWLFIAFYFNFVGDHKI